LKEIDLNGLVEKIAEEHGIGKRCRKALKGVLLAVFWAQKQVQAKKLGKLLEEIKKEEVSAVKELKKAKYRRKPLKRKWFDGYIDGLICAESKIKEAFKSDKNDMGRELPEE